MSKERFIGINLADLLSQARQSFGGGEQHGESQGRVRGCGDVHDGPCLAEMGFSKESESQDREQPQMTDDDYKRGAAVQMAFAMKQAESKLHTMEDILAAKNAGLQMELLEAERKAALAAVASIDKVAELLQALTETQQAAESQAQQFEAKITELRQSREEAHGRRNQLSSAILAAKRQVAKVGDEVVFSPAQVWQILENVMATNAENPFVLPEGLLISSIVQAAQEQAQDQTGAPEEDLAQVLEPQQVVAEGAQETEAVGATAGQ